MSKKWYKSTFVEWTIQSCAHIHKNTVWLITPFFYSHLWNLNVVELFVWLSPSLFVLAFLYFSFCQEHILPCIQCSKQMCSYIIYWKHPIGSANMMLFQQRAKRFKSSFCCWLWAPQAKSFFSLVRLTLPHPWACT